jgi:hypothetical protein
MFKLWNIILDEGKKHDFVLFYLADAIAQPDALIRFIDVMEKHSDAGWVGGVMHRRFPLHRENLQGRCGLHSPFLKFYDEKELPSDWMTTARSWIINGKSVGYPYQVRGITEKEILDRQKRGEGIFNDCCCLGHVWLIRRDVILKGVRFRNGRIEAGLSSERDLDAIGYKIYCDSYVYIKHISVDGKIWRDSLNTELSETEKIYADEKKRIEELVEQQRNEGFILLLFKIAKMTSGSYSLENIKRPIQGETVVCPLTGRILTRETWSDSMYNEYEIILKNKIRLNECYTKATKMYQEFMECKVPSGYRNLLSPEAQQTRNKPPEEITISSTPPFCPPLPSVIKGKTPVLKEETHKIEEISQKTLALPVPVKLEEKKEKYKEPRQGPHP